MALLPILLYPDPRLKKVAKPVTSIDDRIRTLVRDMAATMYEAPGVGLAATQVNVHERVVVIDISAARDELLVLINPTIVALDDATVVSEEGCLSVPDIYERVERPKSVRVRALNEYGADVDLEADGLLAVCIQHELDHLEGKVFVEYLSQFKQSRIKTRIRKLQAA